MSYYNPKSILKKNATYSMVFGERSNGKTYAFLKYGLEQYFKNDSQIAYIRRWKEDIQGKRGSTVFNALIENGEIDASYLSSDSAYTLTKLIYRIPEVIVDAADKYEPSILTRHLVDIAQSFNKFYHDEHILVDNDAERLAKLSLVKASKIAIENCLNILGIKAPERM